jgi:hypothetical protein
MTNINTNSKDSAARSLVLTPASEIRNVRLGRAEEKL